VWSELSSLESSPQLSMRRPSRTLPFLHRLRQSSLYLIPIHNLPPSRDIIASLPFMIQIICMLPNIQSQQNNMTNTIHNRAVLTARRHDPKRRRRAVHDQKHPTRPEHRQRRRGEALLEQRKRCESGRDESQDMRGRCWLSSWDGCHVRGRSGCW